MFCLYSVWGRELVSKGVQKGASEQQASKPSAEPRVRVPRVAVCRGTVREAARMEHLSPVASAGGSSKNTGTEATAAVDNTSVHQHADIDLQAGSAAAVESSTSRFTLP